MAGQHDENLSHPLEQVTGEKDVHPEEERKNRHRAAPGTDDKGGVSGSDPENATEDDTEQ
ncbi:hypothetical protein GCM10010358_44440 [Streptomyces minutiscleroticus]|uniref:Uncharacterized protein n=1 Tax=Streptomyces minutiscleroticus TaxID=68238 RepID=A0A918NPK4_9ACTN|nr:hypothetical protein [Streptomyces minutiscleroticus]GGX85410.1 hypothetical protein GCM10010358_44440 [Streptomyces minutiscleroticus]